MHMPTMIPTLERDQSFHYSLFYLYTYRYIRIFQHCLRVAVVLALPLLRILTRVLPT